MRTRERPAFRNRKHAGCEKGIEEPVAKFEQQLANGQRSPVLQVRLSDAIDNREDGWDYPGRRDDHPGTQTWHSHGVTVSLVQRLRNTNRSFATVRVRRGAARVLIVVRRQVGN